MTHQKVTISSAFYCFLLGETERAQFFSVPKSNSVHLSALMTQSCNPGDAKRASYKSPCHPQAPPPPAGPTRLIIIARSHRNLSCNCRHKVFRLASSCLHTETLPAPETPSQIVQQYHNEKKKNAQNYTFRLH
jgi:hypothetical protein